MATASDLPPGPTRSRVIQYPTNGSPLCLQSPMKAVSSPSNVLERSCPAKEITADSIGRRLQSKAATRSAVLLSKTPKSLMLRSPTHRANQSQCETLGAGATQSAEIEGRHDDNAVLQMSGSLPCQVSTTGVGGLLLLRSLILFLLLDLELGERFLSCCSFSFSAFSFSMALLATSGGDFVVCLGWDG